MNLNPTIALDPVFHFLDGMLEEYGVCIFILCSSGCLFWCWPWCSAADCAGNYPDQPHV